MFSRIAGDTPSHTARIIADSVGSCFSSLTARCRKDRTAESATPMPHPARLPEATDELEAVAMPAPQVSLPSELWGEVATFSSRRDILNLRTTCQQVKAEADRSVTTMTIRGTDNLYNLADSTGFEHLKVLRLHAVDDASLYYLARALHLRHYTQLALVAHQSDIGTLSGAETLSGMPLTGLTLSCKNDLNYFMVRALKVCPFPITLVGQFSRDDLTRLASIPHLIRLDSASESFTDEAADLLASHPMLRTLSIRAFQNISAYGLQRISAAPKLQHLSLYETDYRSTRMTSEGARALAGCRTLTYLHIQTSVTPLSEESFCALAASTSLETLEISISPGVRYLADMVSLKNLTLRGRCLCSGALDIASARALARMPHLRSLSLEYAQLAPGALGTIVQSNAIRHLSLCDVAVTQDTLDAIVKNRHLATLTMRATDITAEQITALSFHPTLEKLRINHTDYPLQHARPRDAGYA